MAGHGVWVIGNTLKATVSTPLGFQKQEAGANAGDEIDEHHLLPQQFKEKFEAKGLDIEKYKIPLPTSQHRLKPDGIHTGPRVDSWNGRWSRFFKEHPNASQAEILEELAKLRQEFGI